MPGANWSEAQARPAGTPGAGQALRGYRVPFPEELAEPGIAQALETAADRCGEALARELEEGAVGHLGRSSGANLPGPAGGGLAD